ncbi:MAG TPA: helix-turn-helix domain-containing protein [Magnetospirillaceae bacterium]|nr:helix-turn-helix domain-containing protein [Magnetospirillaceae bacterium]
MSTLDTKNPICLKSIRLLGDYWMLRIISSLEDGPQRYSEIQRLATGISPATLTNRLKKLEEAKLVQRTEESRAEVLYTLTMLGQDAIPFLAALNTFAQKAEQTKGTLGN